MKTSFLAGLLLLAFSQVGAWAEGEGATPDVVKGYLTPENIEKLEAGKLITFEEQKKDQEGKSKGRGVVIGLIDRPVDAVWTIILDCTTHPEYMPRVVKTEAYKGSDGRDGVYEVLKILWKKVEYHVLQTTDQEKHALSWVLDDSKKNDLLSTTGYWRFIPHKNTQCIGVYAVRVETDMPVPDFVKDFLMKKDLPNVFKALKKRAESDGTYKK